ncbi:MAG: exported protein of unknown function [Candidatus Saccharibacteria bacterium]|jgi:hypothetical protein|nr:exported protein of unknown function [Candidatus Saccharibacteria bacterium]
MKTATSLRRILLTLSAGAAGAVFAFAPPATAATVSSFQVSPPTSNYASDPGGTTKGTIKVTNLTDAPIAIRVTKENFVAKGEEGQIELVNDANPLYSLAPWFNVSLPEFNIPAKKTQEVGYTVGIPVNAEPGGRYGAIVFSTVPPKLPAGQSGAAVQQRIASIVFQRINGAANEELKVESFATGNSNYEKGPVKFITRLKNTGNVHEKATGKIVIKNILGMKVDEIKLAEHFVIPGAIRKLQNDWPEGKKKPFMFGYYTADLDATYAGGKSLKASTSFTVIPWKTVALALIILLILVIFFWRTRKRWRRAFRILSGKE